MCFDGQDWFERTVAHLGSVEKRMARESEQQTKHTNAMADAGTMIQGQLESLIESFYRAPGSGGGSSEFVAEVQLLLHNQVAAGSVAPIAAAPSSEPAAIAASMTASVEGEGSDWGAVVVKALGRLDVVTAVQVVRLVPPPQPLAGSALDLALASAETQMPAALELYYTLRTQVLLCLNIWDL